MLDISKKIKTGSSYIHQFITTDFEYLTKQSKIEYQGINLKTDYLINLIHEIILKYFFNGEIIFDFWSLLLRKKYGKIYNKYIGYLIDKGFISLISNYYVGKKSKTYKINNIEEKTIIKCKVSDPILLKKHSKEFLYKNFISLTNSPIDIELRKKLIDDLYFVEIDYNKAIHFLDQEYNRGQIEKNKYLKNIASVDSIHLKNIFFKFDDYGRLHTNFTILKKEIRQNYLTIEGEKIEEIDIPNSQPFFFVQFLKKEIGVKRFNEECLRFVDLVNNGLIYDDLMEKLQIKERDKAKKIFYRVLFGNNKEKCDENKLFSEIYPTIFDYLIEIKDNDGDYRKLSHYLQKAESDFIFGSIIQTLKEAYPYIKIITIHDSIIYPKKYSNEVKSLFHNYLNILK